MRKIYWTVYFLALFNSNLLWAKPLFSEIMNDYSDSINCHNRKEVEEEFEKLFSVIKNDVLGTKPKFCESYKKHTINDQVNNNSKNEFDQFMELLEKIPSKRKNENPLIIKGGENTYKSTFFEVTRMMTIKKHWQHLSEADKEKVLFDASCSLSQINKLPLNSKKTKGSVKSINYQGMKNICNANNIESIIKYVDKDIMAETFLNLKKLFPENYSQLTKYFCDEVMEMPDALSFNYNDNSIFNTNDVLKKSEEFSDWLINSTKEINYQGEYSQKINEIGKNIKEEEEKNEASGSIGMGMVGDFNSQAMYKEIYEKNKKGEKTLYSFAQSYEIKKLPNGQYVAKLMKNMSFSSQSQEMGKKQTEYLVNKLDSKEFDSEFVTFQKKGKKYEFSFPEKVEKNILEKAKEYQKNIKIGQLKMKEYDQSIEGQKKLKIIFEAYQKPEEKDDILFPYEKSPVFINKEGKYEKESYYDINGNSYSEAIYKEMEKAIHPKKMGEYEVIVTDDSTFLVKDDQNNYMSIFLMANEGYEKSNENGEAYDSSKEKGDEKKENQQEDMPLNKVFSSASYALKQAVSSQYQKTGHLVSKIDQLSAGEINAIKSYTGSAFTQMNGCLRSDNCEDELKEKVNNLKSALQKLSSKKEAILYRGVRELPSDIQQKIDSNQKVILDKGFLSTSGDLLVAKGFAGNGKILMIKSKSCVGISSLSYYKTEDEFLCPPGLTFKAKKLAEKNQYILEEVEK